MTERILWRLFKTVVCLVPTSLILAVAFRMSEMHAAASVAGWTLAVSMIIIACAVLWVAIEAPRS